MAGIMLRLEEVQQLYVGLHVVLRFDRSENCCIDVLERIDCKSFSFGLRKCYFQNLYTAEVAWLRVIYP